MLKKFNWPDFAFSILGFGAYFVSITISYIERGDFCVKDFSQYSYIKYCANNETAGFIVSSVVIIGISIYFLFKAFGINLTMYDSGEKNYWGRGRKQNNQKSNDK